MAGSEQPQDASPLAGAPVIEGYQILSVIGRGGFATVYAAEQGAVGGRVAIKVITAADTDPDTLLRFERESRALGALRGHPHIVTVLDAGHTTDDRPYLVMELVEAGSLQAELVRRRERGEGPLPLERVLDLGVKIASAVATAHARGILHRDLKPGNVLLSDYDDPLLTDFGIARLVDSDASVSGQALSAGFTAPEIIQGQQPTPVSDIFSLGCTLYTLLAGRSPFRRADDAGLLPALNRTVEQPVPDLRPQGVPDQVCRLLEQAMAKDPAGRYRDAVEIGRQLQAIQESLGLPVTGAPFPTDPLPEGLRDSERVEVSAPTLLPGAAQGPQPAPPAVQGGDPAPQGDPVPAPAPRTAPPAAAPPPGKSGEAPPAQPRRISRLAVLLGGILLGVILTIGVLWWALAGGDETPAIEVIIELVDGPEDVVVLIDDPLAEELRAFYGRWAGLLNREEFSEAFELYSPAFRAETSLEEWSSGWETVGIAELLVTQVETDADGVVFSSIEYVTESVDDNAVDPCLVWQVEHSLVPGEDDLRVGERAELAAPRPC